LSYARSSTNIPAIRNLLNCNFTGSSARCHRETVSGY